ncbi:hypothetical protein PRUPE_1G234300 [Prunus persica]|uniref:Uncharacterized protein n=1 Tax=Prunus persica TaxID=3760 RepID=M5XTA5_PRUPE|nr:hypothetical protein PRUPE_1G234300 [Prunus persica]
MRNAASNSCFVVSSIWYLCKFQNHELHCCVEFLLNVRVKRAKNRGTNRKVYGQLSNSVQPLNAHNHAMLPPKRAKKQ